MDILLEEATRRFREAIEQGEPEDICVAARFLRLCAGRARSGYIDTWKGERAAAVGRSFKKALETLRGLGTNDSNKWKQKVAQYSYQRVLRRLTDLFPEEAEPYEKYAEEIGPVVLM